MPRKARIVVPNTPHHVVQRGHNREAVFAERQDYMYYLSNLREWKEKLNCRIYAYCLMTNHVHLIVDPGECVEHLGLLMKRISGRQAMLVNRLERRTGSLWEGRYKSSPVDTDEYLLACCRYVELNPVRAAMVHLPEEYPWSSYRAKVGLEKNAWLDPNPCYLALGTSEDQRQACYAKWVRSCIPEQETALIRTALQRGQLTGNTRFAEQVARKIGRRIEARGRGRPRSGRREMRKIDTSPFYKDSRMNRALRLLIVTLSVAAGSFWLNMAYAASFDCAKARTKVEKLICADPFISKLDSQLGKVYDKDIAKANAEQRKRLVTEELNWLKGMRDRCTTQACLKQVYMQRLAELKAFAGPHSPKRKILGHYVAHPVNLGHTYAMIAPVCRTLVANFNEFRDVPFESNNPRLSPKYPQFRRVWKPMAWNRELAERVYTGCTSRACMKKGGGPAWRYWLKYTKPLRQAGKPLLWRARLDLLGDGRHETLIRLTHIFAPKMVDGKQVLVPPSKPYSRYFDSLISMLPSPYPKMAKIFNLGTGTGVTDIIQNVGSKKAPYLSLAWKRDRMEIGVSAFLPAWGGGYVFAPMCNVAWIPRGE